MKNSKIIKNHYFVTSFLLLSLQPVSAAGFKNATYSMAQGTVQISKANNGSFHFELDNFSLATTNIFSPSRPEDSTPRFCSITGTAKTKDSTTAFYETGKKDSGDYCHLQFTLKDLLLEVTSTECQECDSTSPDGVYRVDDGHCDIKKLKTRRAEFNTDFKSKRYADSVKKLEALLNDCKIMLSNPDISWLLNDLALARFKADDKKGCLAAIAEIPMGLEGKLAKAVKFNENLCKK